MATKRKAEPDRPAEGHERAKKRKQWRTPKQVQRSALNHGRDIAPGDRGIWATCVRGKESHATRELLDILNEYATKLYCDHEADRDLPGSRKDAPLQDVEEQVNIELQDFGTNRGKSFFQSVKVDMHCVIFIKTLAPVDTVDLVQLICKELELGRPINRSRYLQRLTPITVTGKATEKDLEEIAKAVVQPVLGASCPARQFAIRITGRNHTMLKRDWIISKVASIVESGHSVNLSSPDIVILVEVYKNICCMGAVSGDYDRLKRYNLAEISKISQARA